MSQSKAVCCGLLLICQFQLVAAAPSQGAPFWPGANPEAFRITVQTNYIRIQNEALSVSWARGAGGISPSMVKDEKAQTELTRSGELFKIVLEGGHILTSSNFVIEREPVIRELPLNPRASRTAATRAGRELEVPFISKEANLRVVWRAIARDDANYIREELEISAGQGSAPIREIRWIEEPAPNDCSAGEVDGSPVVAGNFFFGIEDPMAANVVSNGSVVCRLERRAVMAPGEKITISAVTGVAPAGQMRRGFLCYLEAERAHPYRPFLHYNSWYDIAWHPFALNETNCLEAIRTFGDRFVRAHEVKVDAMVFDDGWDDPKSLWQFHRGFPNGFTPLAELCRNYGMRLGVWLSPFGGYGVPKEQRLVFGGAQGFETNATGFSLAGPRYYAAFKNSCVEMIRKYGVIHFKFDGIAKGMYASGGGQYIRDTEAMRRLMLQLREEDPAVYVNLTTGSWPSPFWLRYADSLWRQGGDMGVAGKGTKQQQWLTYRDQEVYRNIVRKSPLYPLNALMTQGVAYSRYGMAGDPTFDSAGFRDDVHAFFGSGTGLQELYIQPGKLTESDWSFLAEAAKWSRANADVLVDSHWIGGDPSKLEIYGYASWSPRKGVLMLRNPADRAGSFLAELTKVFELPAGAPADYTLRTAWGEEGPALRAKAGKPFEIVLQPFEVRVFDALPVR